MRSRPRCKLCPSKTVSLKGCSRGGAAQVRIQLPHRNRPLMGQAYFLQKVFEPLVVAYFVKGRADSDFAKEGSAFLICLAQPGYRFFILSEFRIEFREIESRNVCFFAFFSQLTQTQFDDTIVASCFVSLLNGVSTLHVTGEQQGLLDLRYGLSVHALAQIGSGESKVGFRGAVVEPQDFLELRDGLIVPAQSEKRGRL